MQTSAPVKYFVTILTNNITLRENVIDILKEKLGDIDYVSPWYPFSHTNYYSSEMGEGLKRSFVSFSKLCPPEGLPRIKELTSVVEDEFRVNGNRSVNIDPGYIDYTKLVIASGKYAAYRISLTSRCYADFVMYYDNGKFIPLPWCFQDFAKGLYNEALVNIRKLFKETKNLP